MEPLKVEPIISGRKACQILGELKGCREIGMPGRRRFPAAGSFPQMLDRDSDVPVVQRKQPQLMVGRSVIGLDFEDLRVASPRFTQIAGHGLGRGKIVAQRDRVARAEEALAINGNRRFGLALFNKVLAQV